MQHRGYCSQFPENSWSFSISLPVELKVNMLLSPLHLTGNAEVAGTPA